MGNRQVTRLPTLNCFISVYVLFTDLAFMPKDEDYIGFLTACDGFSQYCYTGLIKSKRSEEMKKILSSFFEDNKDTPMKINSDEGNVSKVNLICKTM